MNPQKRFFALAVVAFALMSASGCVCVTNHNTSGNVTFLWTFGGQTCAVVPDIASVTIQIPGQTLANGGAYGCLNGAPSTAGIVLLDFQPGTYSFTIQGNDSSGTSLYESSGKFTVAGNVTVNVDLSPSANAPGNALVTWSFPGNGACATVVGEPIGTVDIIIDNATTLHQACNSGIVGSQGVQVTGLLSGTHTMELRAFGANSNYQYFGVINSIAINAGGTVSGEFSLGWTVGSLPLKWQFADSQGAATCEQLGSPLVYVNLKDNSTGKLLYPDNNGSGRSVPCKNGDGLQGTLFPYLYGGSYTVYIQAVGPNNALYSSDQRPNQAPVATVTAGVFPQLDANTFAINVTNP